MAQKKVTVYGLLLLVLLLTANLAMSAGQSYARYTDDVLLVNTVAQPSEASVTSEFLFAENDAYLTVDLGQHGMAASVVDFTMEAPAEVTGSLHWIVDQEDYLVVAMSRDGVPLELDAPFTLPQGETTITMALLPTEEAAALKQDVEINITVIWNNTLTGIFTVTLTQQPIEPEVEATTGPDTDGQEEPSEPGSEENPTEPEETQTELQEGAAPAEELENTPSDEEEQTQPQEPENAARLALSGTVSLTGRSLNPGEFTFVLHQADSEYTTDPEGAPLRTAVNDAEGGFAFEELTYTEPGDYYYVVSEDASAKLGGMEYDSYRHQIHVIVTAEEEQLEAQLAEAVELQFVNYYTPKPTTFTISGTKRLTGGLLKEGMFNLQLYEADEQFNTEEDPLETVPNGADGSFTFEELTFDQAGTYCYVVQEERLEDQTQITYDTRSYGIIVTVTDDGLGQLSAAASLSLIDGETVDEADALVFSNIYTPTEDELPVVRLATIGAFDPDGLLPVQVTWIEGVEQIRLGMGSGEGEAIPFPARTCYSLDQGNTYEMLYHGGFVELDTTDGDSTQVLLDLSRVQLPVIVETIENEGLDTVVRMADVVLTARAYAGESQAGQADTAARPVLNPYYQMVSNVLNQHAPLEISFPEAWKALELEYSVQMLALPELSEEEAAAGAVSVAEYVDLEQIDPDGQSLTVAYTADETGHMLALQTGALLPPAGTYRIHLNWKYEGCCFEKTQMTFFVNYSVEQTQTVTGGAEQ